jgi:hypothetical protein
VPDESHTSWKSYFTFRRTGRFRADDIIAVHPAHRQDPTHTGFYGTPTLRSSLDYYVDSLTFSVVVWNSGSLSGFYTLDIECETQEIYFTLLHGFYLLCQEAAAKRAAHMSMSLADKCRARLELAVHVWQGTKAVIASISHQLEHREQEQLDPIELLFQSTDSRQIFAEAKKEQYHNTSNSSPKYGLPPAQFLGWKSAGTQIWARLKMAGLEVKCVFSWDLQKVIFNVRCPQWRLEEVAEHMHIKLRNR